MYLWKSMVNEFDYDFRREECTVASRCASLMDGVLEYITKYSKSTRLPVHKCFHHQGKEISSMKEGSYLK